MFPFCLKRPKVKIGGSGAVQSKKRGHFGHLFQLEHTVATLCGSQPQQSLSPPGWLPVAQKRGAGRDEEKAVEGSESRCLPSISPLLLWPAAELKSNVAGLGGRAIGKV